MVDTRDLKSLGHCGRVGSSPTSGTDNITAASGFLRKAAVFFVYMMHIIIVNLSKIGMHIVYF